MATEVALRLLEQYVGKYVVGLEGNRLRIALWRGEVRPAAPRARAPARPRAALSARRPLAPRSRAL